VVIAYADNANSNHGTAIVGTVSGTSISFGSAAVFESAAVEFNSIVYDSNAQKVVIAYQDEGNSSHGTAIVGTVSSTSISFGSAVVFQASTSLDISAAYDASAQKVVIAYQNNATDEGTAIVGTVSDTSISFGSSAVFESAAVDNCAAVYDSNAQKVVIAYEDEGNSGHGTLVEATVSGTSLSFSSATVFESASVVYVSAAYDSNANRTVIAYRDGGNSDYGTAIVFKASSTNLTSENFIGFAENDCTDNGLATIQLGGSVNNKQTSLTAGQTYFVQTDGTIGTTADSPSVTAGTAVSATEILVKG
jgi:alpha-L-arabinofuranosidase